MLRWLANAGELCPWTRPRVAAAIRASAEAAVRTCAGGPTGRACGMRWIADEGGVGGGGGDVGGDGGIRSLPEEMNVMTALMTRLHVDGWGGEGDDQAEDAPGGNGIATIDTGGTSRGDPHAGKNRRPGGDLGDLDEMVPFETVAAWIYTVLLFVAFGLMCSWICTSNPVEGVAAQDIESVAVVAPPAPSTSGPGAESPGVDARRRGLDLNSQGPASAERRGFEPKGKGKGPAPPPQAGPSCETRRTRRSQRAEDVARQRHDRGCSSASCPAGAVHVPEERLRPGA